MQLTKNPTAAASPEIHLGHADVYLTPNADLLTKASYSVGKLEGYATIGDAERAARILSAGHAPAIAVLAGSDNRFALSKVAYASWGEPFPSWYHIDPTDRAIRFDTPSFRAIVDGDYAIRAGALGKYVPVTKS